MLFPAIVTPMLSLFTATSETAPSLEKVKPLYLQTRLVENGTACALLVAPRSAAYAPAIQRLQDHLKATVGTSLPLRDPEAVSEADLKTFHVVAIGPVPDNPFVERLYHQQFIRETWRPGAQGVVVRSIHNPYNTGRNILFVGAEGPDRIGVAVEILLTHLKAEGHSVELPGYLLAFETGRSVPRVSEAERRRHETSTANSVKFNNGRVLISGAASMAENYLRTGSPDYAELFKLYMARHQELKGPGMGTHMNLWNAIVAWDLIEESPLFSDEERLRISNHLLYLLRSTEGARYPFFQKGIQIGGVRHNHQTLPGLDAYFGGRYFKTWGLEAEGNEYIEWARRLFVTQSQHHKPQCDSNQYEWTTLYQTAYWALATGDTTLFDNGQYRKAADRALIEIDNLGWSAGSGDCWTAFSFPLETMRQAAAYYRDGRYQWMIEKRYGPNSRGVEDLRRGVHPVEPRDLLGIAIAPMDEGFYRLHEVVTDPPPPQPNLPFERCFDKISFRRSFDPEEEYLLLDGTGMGSHGHLDTNCIARLTANGRIWLVDMSYTEGPNMRDHCAVTVLRNGLGEKAPPLASLDAADDLDTLGMTQTSVPRYNGLDWRRHLFWLKGEGFLAVDELEAVEAGDYNTRCYWHALGEATLEGPDLRLVQKPKEGPGRVDTLAIQSAGAQSLSLVRDTENFGKWWADYAYAPPVVNILQQAISGPMVPGERRCFANLLFATNEERPRRLLLEARGPAWLVRNVGGTESLLVALQPGRMLKGLETDAKAVILGSDRVAARGVTRFRFGWVDLRTEAPIAFEANLAARRLTVQAGAKPTRLQMGGRAFPLKPGRNEVSISPARPLTAEMEALLGSLSVAPRLAEKPTPYPGSKGITQRWAADLGTPVLTLAVADLDGNGKREISAGCEDSRVCLLDDTGRLLWQFQTGGKVNSVCVADVDGDGKREVIAGSDDRKCYCLRLDGTQMWSFEGASGDDPYWRRYWKAGEVEKVIAADIDGDGKDEVAFGAANMNLHALDHDGRLLWKYTQYGVITSLLAADVNGDGRPEVVGGPSKITCTSQVAVLDSSGKILGRHSNDGWSSALTAIAVADLDGSGKPTILCGTNHNNVHALQSDAAGSLSLRWKFALGDTVTSLCGADLEGTGRSCVLVGSASEYIHCLNPDGTLRWATPIEGVPSQLIPVPAEGKRQEVLAVTPNRIYRLDGAGKVIAWASEPTEVTEAAWDGALYLATRSGRISSLEAP